MLSIRGLRKSFGGVKTRAVLAGIDLDLAPGEFVAIMGESGSGKSTLLNLIAGLERPDAGTIVFEGTELATLSDDERARFRRLHLGFVFQAFHLLPYLSVTDNVALPLLLGGCTASERDARAAQMLSAVGLSDRGQALPRELSGGEMQRVAIARALVHRPRLVLADEPTGNLDIEHASQVLSLLRERVNSNATACILVTHSPVAARIAERTYLLDASGLHRSSIPR